MTLQKAITLDGVIRHASKLEQFARSYPDGSRVAGSSAHNDTLQHIVDELRSTKYYHIEQQPYQIKSSVSSNSSLVINGQGVASTALTYTRNGTFENVPLVWSDSFGCNGVSILVNTFGETVQMSTC